MLKRRLSQIRSGKAKHLRLNCAHSLFLLGLRKFTLSMPRNKGHEPCSSKKTVCVKFNKDKTKFAEFLSAAVWVKIEKLILLQLSDGIKWFQTTFGPFWRQLTSQIIVSSHFFSNKSYSLKIIFSEIFPEESMFPAFRFPQQMIFSGLRLLI